MSPPKSLIAAHAVAISIFAVVYSGMSNFKNINDTLAFYGVYHRNPINQMIHFFGVPCIIWSLLVFLSHLNLNMITINGLPFAPKHVLNYATLLSIGYIIFYIKMDLFGGLLYAPFAYFLYVTAVSVKVKDEIRASNEIMSQSKKEDGDRDANKSVSGSTLTSWTGTGRALKIAAVVHFLGWYVQIHPGHGVYEGAKPAVLQSVGGALTSAPLFAYYEGLWFLGLNKDLQQETKLLVDVYTKELCDSGVTMRACADYV
mmetsp:Transcript_16327/g.20665  ORF Transcript_16327/g.20665 Transcript_16327/m.20665 type:complete len:258 (-) Transcript_16327:2-775(-)|eukprot:CAMPEP_0203715158 /NCGR_PEP_ID=MMETSP0091-20130426/71453_1 /ASSEMBLY_ACC=CAM_ASM_001089 /TAXON_ID=426623 /ORGANISM="Chaetoceros affinis, Strain CCMP159" /LENGTH=257 /DNA_ID=CAMNT_0050593245 /DNA_START=67 /DNA_END=840 /DNA_ORIENTATION=+